MKWKVNNYFGINHKITDNLNLFRCSFAVMKLIFRMKITPFLFPPAFTCTMYIFLAVTSNLNYLIYLENSMYKKSSDI